MTKQEIISDLINTLITIYPEAIELESSPPPPKSNDVHFIRLSKSAPFVLALTFDNTSNMCLFQCLTPPKDRLELWSAKDDKVRYGALVVPYARQIIDTIPLAGKMFIIKKIYAGEARVDREYTINELATILSQGFLLPPVYE